MRKSEVLMILAIISIYFFTIFYVGRYIPVQGINKEDIFITSLLGRGFVLPLYVTQIFGFGNLILIYLIGKKIFSNKVGLLSSLIYTLSPWTVYVSVAGSFYIFILFWLMLSFLGAIILKIDKSRYGLFLLFLGIIVATYSSLIVVLMLPIFFYMLFKLDVLDLSTLRQNKILSLLILLFGILFVFIISKNPIGFRNILSRDINLFSNIGLINSVNDFRGLSEKVGFSLVGKLVENKVTYLGRHVLFNFLAQYTPTTYFTSQEKLLGFSFSPPILFGFIFPFFLGLREILNRIKKKNLLLILSFSLVLPSILSIKSPDLDRLVLLSPLIFFPISLGLIKGFESRSLVKILMCCAIFVVVIQGIVVLRDISYREPLRYENLVRK